MNQVSIANKSPVMEPDMTYASSPWAYSQRKVMFSYKNDSDHCPESPTSLQKTQLKSSDIKDLLSIAYQLLNDERSNRSSSSAVHPDHQIHQGYI